MIKEDGLQAFSAEVRRTFSSPKEAIAWEARVNRRLINRAAVLNTAAWPAVNKEGHHRSKISKATVGNDGLTPSQRGGLKWKMIKNEIHPEYGITYAEVRRKKYNESLDRNDTRRIGRKGMVGDANPSRRPEVGRKISASLKAGIADGTIKTTKGMKIPKISEALKGNTAVKGYKWYNDGVHDVRLLPSDPASQGLQPGRLKTKEVGWSYTLLTCPHCGHVGGGGNMKRYHFTACKAVRTLDLD